MRRDELHEYYWGIPVFYALGAVGLGFVVPRLEAQFFPTAAPINYESAIAIFSSIASGMLALTGIVFSLAFVMVQFNATAYSPRLVVWLARERLLFHSIGIFTATFIYALVALTWVGRNNTRTVPMWTSFVAMLLLLASVIALARLIQRLSLLKIASVLAFLGETGRKVIAEMYPTSLGSAGGPPTALAELPPVTQTVCHSGVPKAIASFDLTALLALAEEAHAVIEITDAVGDTAVDGLSLLHVRGAAVPIPEARLRRAIHLAPDRTFEQDPKYALRLLVDISIRALSPAINDPTTAVQAISQIEDLLRLLARRRLDTGRIRDRSGNLRVLFPVPTWEDYLSLALDEIRTYGAQSVQVMRRMRALLRDMHLHAQPERQAAIEIYLQRVNRSVQRNFPELEDRRDAQTEDRQGMGMSRRSASEVA